MEAASGRPQAVTWLIVLVLTFTGGELLGGIASLRHWSLLNALPLSVSPLYILLRHLGWAAIGAPLAWALFQAKAWAPQGLRFASLAFAAFYWLEREWLQVNEPINGNRGFALGATLVLVSFVFWMLSRPAVLACFGEPHE